MNVDLDALFQLVVGAAMIGFGTDHFRLRREMGGFRELVLKDYASKLDVDKVVSAVEKVDARVESMIELLYAIKGQVGAMGHDGTR